MQSILSPETIKQVAELIANREDDAIIAFLSDFHFADIAEMLDELDIEESTYILKLLDTGVTSEVFIEIDEELRKKILKNFSPSEIAEELEEMDTDDATDIITELDEDIQQDVIRHIEDTEHARSEEHTSELQSRPQLVCRLLLEK